jgi:hypothetical protein
LQYVVGSEPVASVDSQHSPVEAQHDGLIGMRKDPLDILQSERPQPFRKTIIEEETLPSVRAYPLTH